MASLEGSTEALYGGSFIPDSDHCEDNAVIDAIEQTDDVVYGYIEETVPNALNILIHPSGNRKLKEVSKKLAEIGEAIEKSYESEFRQLFRQLGLSSNNTLSYEEFVDFAFGFIANEIKWSNVIALIVFVCYTIKRFEKEGAIVNKIVPFVLRFLKEKIAGWIASQGGWRAALNEVVEKARAISPLLICIASCAVVVQAVLYVYSFRRK